MPTSLEISLRDPSKTQPGSPNSPIRKVRPSPEKKTNWTVALVSPKKHFLDGDPTRKSNDAADTLETVDTVPTAAGAAKQTSDDFSGEHSTAEATPPVRAAECSASGSAQLELATCSRHIVYPSGSMKLPDGRYRGLTDEEKSLIHVLFPRAYRYNFCAPISVIVFHELPPKPWPLTIGGMPIYFTTDPKKLPYPHGLYGLTGRALQDHAIERWVTPSDQQMWSIFEYFDMQLHIRVHSVIWLGCRFHVVVPLGTRREDVPGAVLALLCSYSFPDPIPRKEAALRNLQPTNLLQDDSDYSPILRPGVMLSCGNGANNELLTSSGVPVKDGKHFVTVASRGFPVGEEMIWHPNASGSVIGEVKETLGETNISLMELRPGYHYSTEVFSTTHTPTHVLRQFRHHDSIRIGDPVYLDSPFSGPVDGTVIGVVSQLKGDYILPDTKLPGDDDGYVKNLWLYIGSGHAEHLQGICGSAVWDDNGDVVGFFRFVNEDGNALITSPAPLMQHGWEIAAIP